MCFFTIRLLAGRSSQSALHWHCVCRLLGASPLALALLFTLAPPPPPLRDTWLGIGVVLFGAITLRGISAYVTCHISHIETIDSDTLLVKSLAMPFGDKQQLITRHAFHAMGSGELAPAVLSRDVLVSLLLLQCTGYEPIDLSNVNATKLVYVIVDDKPHIMNVATGVRCPPLPSRPFTSRSI